MGKGFLMTAAGKCMAAHILAACALAALTLLCHPRPAAAAEGPVLRIGAVVSLNGPAAEIAAHVVRGYDLAAKRINAMGGLAVGNMAYRIDIIYGDDRSDTAQAANVARTLIRNERVKFLLGPVTSNLVLAVAEQASRYRTPLVQSGGASSHVYRKDLDYSFGVTGAAENYLSGALDLAVSRAAQKRGGKGRKPPAKLKLALMFQSDLLTQDIRAGVLARAKALAIDVVLDLKLPDTITSLSEPLRQVKQAAPDILLVSGRGQAAKLLARDMQAAGLDLPMAALTHCDSAGVEEQGRFTDYLICATQWNVYGADRGRWFGRSIDFQVDFELEYGYRPPYQAAEAAAAVLTLADALERAASLDSQRVREALARTDLKTFFGPVRFDATGRNKAKGSFLQQILGGRYRMVWPPAAATTDAVYPIPRWRDR